MMTDPFRAELIALLPRLRRFAFGLTTDADRADDLVQAGCERALVRSHQWQPGTRLDSWMFKILQNLWIDQLRGRPRDAASANWDADEVESVADRDWNQGIEAKLTLEQVAVAMGKLSPPMRAVLSLVCIEGMSYQEAADTLDVPIGTVMSRLARARTELMRVLHGGSTPQAPEATRHAPLH